MNTATEYTSLPLKDQFLIRCAKIAKGNTDLGISLDKMVKNDDDNQTAEEIVQDLISLGCINKLTEAKEIFLTRKAFYYVIHITKEDPTSYGIEKRKDYQLMY